MQMLVRVLLVVTVAVLLIDVIASLVSGGDGLVEKIVLLGVGLLLLWASITLRLKSTHQGS